MSADHIQAMTACEMGLRAEADRVRNVFASASDGEVVEWLRIQGDPLGTILVSIGGAVPTHPIYQTIAQAAKETRAWDAKLSKLRMAKAEADKAARLHQDAIAAVLPLSESGR